MTFRFAVLTAATVLACPATSQEGIPDWARATATEALDIFYGMCMNDDYRSQLLIDMASDANWPEMPPDILAQHRPDAPQSFWGGWMATPPGQLTPFFVAFAGISVDGIETCGSYFRQLDTSEFLEKFVNENGAQLIDEVTNGEIDYRIFTLPNFENIVVNIGIDQAEGDVQAFALYMK